MSGLQCEKKLWLETHRKDLLKHSARTEAVFAKGFRVGEMACREFPDGVMMPDDLREALVRTQAALAQKIPIFEATFQHEGVLVRIDILEPDGDGWVLNEVKASTSVKDVHVPDCAIQAWLLEQAGVTVTRVNLMHVDNSFVYPGNGDYRGLFIRADLTEAVRELLPQVPKWVSRLRSVLGDECPEIDIGDQCTSPYDCAFRTLCAPPGPEYPVGILYRGGKRVQELIDAGYIDLTDVPRELLRGEMHVHQWEASRSGDPYIGEGAIRSIGSLGFPRYYLDFETAAPAVPIWAGTRPYQAIPFQWSIHAEHEDARTEHFECLVTDGSDPRRVFAERMIEALGNAGAILTYSAYEKRIINELITVLPDLAAPLEAIKARLFDLLPLTREHYYHPNMKGSFSIKAVLPTIAPEMNYADLDDVSDGGAAEAAFLEIVDARCPPERKQILETALLRYCRMDTEALLKLANFFNRSEVRG